MDLDVIAKHIKAIEQLKMARDSSARAIEYHAKLIGMESEIMPHPPVDFLSANQWAIISDYIEGFKFLYPHKLSPKFAANTIGLRLDR
jgi:hypothetical protein